MIFLEVSEESSEFECDEFTVFDDDEKITQFSNIEQVELQHDEAMQGRLETCDPRTFRTASLWYLFTKSSYLYMIQCVQGQIQATGESILSVEPSWSIYGQPNGKLHQVLLKK